MSVYTIPQFTHREGRVWLECIQLNQLDLIDLIQQLEIEGICAAKAGDQAGVLRAQIMIQQLELPMREAREYWARRVAAEGGK